MNIFYRTITYANHVPLVVRVTFAVIFVAIAVYLYAIVSSVLYVSLQQETLADVRVTEHNIAKLEMAYLHAVHEVTAEEAPVYALLPAESVVYVENRTNGRFTMAQ